MTTVTAFGATLAADRHLGTLITTRLGDLDPQVSVVNVGIIQHPLNGAEVVAIVARRGAKLAHLRSHPRATVVARAGWQWVALRGPAELSGPDDPQLGLDPTRQKHLLRDIYHAAGGLHLDLGSYDRTMVDERRCAVLIHPEHIWTNPPGSEHIEAADPTGEHL